MFGLVCGSRLVVRAGLVAGVLLVWANGVNAAGKPTSGGAPPAPPPSHPSTAPAPPPPPPVATCPKPVIPGCMDDGGTFAVPERMTSCQGEVKEYVDRTMVYLKCLNDENVASGRDLTRNVDRFNCRLSGRKACP